MGDVATVVRMDMETTLVPVLKSVRKRRTGLAIGSPISAGAASLVAAVRERRCWNAFSADAQRRIVAAVFLRRWLDDVLVVVDKLKCDNDVFTFGTYTYDKPDYTDNGTIDIGIS